METRINPKLTSVQNYLDTFCTDFAARDFMKQLVGRETVKHTFAEFHADVYALADGLKEADMTDKHIAILSENRYEFIVAFFACLLAGAVFVPINIMEKEKIAFMLDYADADAVILTKVTAPYLPLVKAACPRVKRFFSFDEVDGCEALPTSGHRGSAYYGDFADDRTALLCFTSGTSSGKPKCVMLTAGNLFASARHETHRFVKLPDGKMSDICIYTPLPLFHLAALISVVVKICIPSGNLFTTSSSVSSCFRDVCTFCPDYILTVPALAQALCDIMMKAGGMNEAEVASVPFDSLSMDDLRARRRTYHHAVASVSAPLQMITLCGAKTSDDLEKKLTALGIFIGCSYGLTECSPEVSMDAPPLAKHLGGNGEICSFNEAKIVDGVLYVRGENVMKGYYKNPEATREVLFEDGWLCTGDLAEIKDGYLYIKGRNSSVVVLSNGDNIDTDELSGVFLNSPAVREIILLPDLKNNNDTLVALIYPAEGETQETVAKSIADINRTLPLQKRISRFRTVDKPFEKNEMMKIKRFLYQQETV